MAERGAPTGNQNAAKGKRWVNAIEKALAIKSKAEGQDALVKIAEGVVEEALDRNPAAIQEIANRLDGKPAQAVNVGGQEGNPVGIAVTDVVLRALRDDEEPE